MPYYLLAIGCLSLLCSIFMLHHSEMHAIDSQLLILAEHSRQAGLNTFTEILSKVGGMPAVITFCSVLSVILIRNKKKLITIYLFLSIGGGIALGWLLKYLIQRDRPTMVSHLVQSYGASFPSAHSLYAIVLSSFLALFVIQPVQTTYSKIRLVLIFLWPLIMGISRVYLGVHYPSDVLAGWGIGLIWVSLLYLMYQKKQMPSFYAKSKSK